MKKGADVKVYSLLYEMFVHQFGRGNLAEKKLHDYYIKLIKL